MKDTTKCTTYVSLRTSNNYREFIIALSEVPNGSPDVFNPRCKPNCIMSAFGGSIQLRKKTDTRISVLSAQYGIEAQHIFITFQLVSLPTHSFHKSLWIDHHRQETYYKTIAMFGPSYFLYLFTIELRLGCKLGYSLLFKWKVLGRPPSDHAYCVKAIICTLVQHICPGGSN